MHTLYPLQFRPVYKDYLWGGTKIAREFRRNVPPGIQAESWEISDRPEGMSVVENGPLAGTTLRDLVSMFGDRLLGRGRSWPTFPLLVKVLDARETLSVQVHPNDATAAKHGGEPKTEMWHVLQADPGAHVFAGVKAGITESDLRRAIADGSLEPLLNRVEVKAGDTVFMPGGRIHAIGAGCMMLEIQQNSNTTYRLYDWGRVGADGKPRELHVEAGLRVMEREGDDVPTLETCPFFRFRTLQCDHPTTLDLDGSSFVIGFVIEGALTVEDLSLRRGMSFLLPASLPRVHLSPLAPARLALARVP